MASAASPIAPAVYGTSSSSSRSCGLRKRFIEDSKSNDNPSSLSSLPATLEKYNPAYTSLGSHTEAQPGPDIAWNPSLETYLLRVRRLAKLGESLPTSVPAGFPASINSARVWSGSDFHDEKKYIVEFAPEDVREIEDALAYFKSMCPPAGSSLLLI